MTLAYPIYYGLLGWGALGLGVALVFVAVGLPRIDEAARGSSIFFRLLLVPGCAVLWPVVLRRWIRGRAAEASR